MFFLTPRHVKQGRQFVKDARKVLAYKRDLWSAATIAEVEQHIAKLEATVRSRDKAQISDAAQQLDTLLGQHLPAPTDAALRENVEVFLVAIAVALGVRTYFLQPFTIPTGSMQPTLNGIICTATSEPPANFFVRTFQGLIWGRQYVNFVAKEDERVDEVREIKSLLPLIARTPFIDNFGFFTRTLIHTDHGDSYVIKESLESVRREFIDPLQGRLFKAGEPIVRGYIESGDMVFVDKFSYHFRKPPRDSVLVFNTQGLPTRENQNQHMVGPSQYYIKRLAGLPNDELRIDEPLFFVNGQRAVGRGYERVMQGTRQNPVNGYYGYSNGETLGFRSGILGKSGVPFTLGSKEYFALGDNSYHSSDSRDWGPVPQTNIMGRGVFVYWPFTKHWGLIR